MLYFWETAGIRCACMTLFAISYSTITEINRSDQSDLDILLVNGDALYKTFIRQTLLTAEDLLRNFDLGEEKEEKVYPHFKENKYGILD